VFDDVAALSTLLSGATMPVLLDALSSVRRLVVRNEVPDVVKASPAVGADFDVA